MTLDLSAIESRAAAATPGPWEYFDGDIDAASGGGVAVLCEHKSTQAIKTAGGQHYDHATGEFIAHARSDIDLLCAEVRRLTADRVHWKQLAVMREDAHTQGYREGRDIARIELAEANQTIAKLRERLAAFERAQNEAVAVGDDLSVPGGRLLTAATTEERRAPVQGGRVIKPDGTVAWHEHLAACEAYERKFGLNKPAERFAERGGFGYAELTVYLGHEPKTWRPHGPR